MAYPAALAVLVRPTTRRLPRSALRSWCLCTRASPRVRLISQRLPTVVEFRFCTKTIRLFARFRFRLNPDFMRYQPETEFRIGKLHCCILGTPLRPRCSRPAFVMETAQPNASSVQSVNHCGGDEPLPGKPLNSWPRCPLRHSNSMEFGTL